MTIRVTRTGQIRADATPVTRVSTPRRKRGADLSPYSVPSDQRAGELSVRQVPQVLATRTDLSAAQLAAHAPVIRTEPPYKQYALNDPRRPRGIDRLHDTDCNTTRTPNPRRTGARNTGEPAADGHH